MSVSWGLCNKAGSLGGEPSSSPSGGRRGGSRPNDVHGPQTRPVTCTHSCHSVLVGASVAWHPSLVSLSGGLNSLRVSSTWMLDQNKHRQSRAVSMTGTTAELDGHKRQVKCILDPISGSDAPGSSQKRSVGFQCLPSTRSWCNEVSRERVRWKHRRDRRGTEGRRQLAGTAGLCPLLRES